MGWTKLYHQGIYSHKDYNSPLNIKIKYNNIFLVISKKCEQALILYSKINKQYIDNTFNINFINSIRHILPTECKKIKTIHDIKIPFTNLSKQNIYKLDKNILEKYSKITINGKNEMIEKCSADPAYIFIGRGLHPLRGTFKNSIKESDIILNCSTKCNIPGKWKSIVHNKDVDWIACWKDCISKKYIYIYPHASSNLKKSNTIQKFDFSRKIKSKLKYIQSIYLKDIKSTNINKKQHAIATYLIDKLLLRCGNETDDHDTYGCTTLLNKHITINNNNISFNFISKDSILFKKTLKCDIQFIIDFLKEKQKYKNNNVFDKISSTTLNCYLNSIVPNLTAKVFRTTNASIEFEKKISNAKTVDEFKKANTYIAEICNHTNLNTSKSNYIDPRIIFSFSKKNNIKINLLFSPILIQKYKWAENTDSSFRF